MLITTENQAVAAFAAGLRPQGQVRNHRTASLNPADVADYDDWLAGELGPREGIERAQLEAFLRSHPAHTVRQWKGKGEALLSDSPMTVKQWLAFMLWAKGTKDFVTLVTRPLARELPHAVRQAAASHPQLIFNPLARRYRIRVADDPSPFAPELTSCPTRGQNVEDPSEEERLRS